MYSLNNCEFIGNLGDNPELANNSSGNSYAKASLACTKKWTDKGTGEKKSVTTWVPIVMFGYTADNFYKMAQKGSLVYVSGEFNTRKYADNNSGQDRWFTSIVVRDFLMLNQGQVDTGQHSGTQAVSAQAQPQQQVNVGLDDDLDDDIPF